MSLIANWSYPTSIRFGAGRIRELGDACAQAGIENPLLVTDRGLAELPVTKDALARMEEAGFNPSLFAEVDPNPTEVNLAAGIEVFKDGGHDGVIAFGGGSGLDLAKMIAFMAEQSRPIWDFEDIGDWWTRADSEVIYPSIAIPTTAGTGSEVGRASVITNSETHTKKIIFHPKVLPSVVIADPEVTISMPKTITAGTGMDAFAHCLEAYCSPFYHPMSQGIAIEGMRLVKENLLRAFEQPDDLEARGHMMSAAAMGATAFQKGLGAIHALSHPVGALFDTHHGTTNAVVMPNVLAFNRQAIEAKIEALAAFLGIAGGFDGFRAFVVDMNDRLGIPKGLSNLGVTRDKIGKLAEMAAVDPAGGGNPIPLNVENCRALYDQVI